MPPASRPPNRPGWIELPSSDRLLPTDSACCSLTQRERFPRCSTASRLTPLRVGCPGCQAPALRRHALASDFRQRMGRNPCKTVRNVEEKPSRPVFTRSSQSTTRQQLLAIPRSTLRPVSLGLYVEHSTLRSYNLAHFAVAVGGADRSGPRGAAKLCIELLGRANTQDGRCRTAFGRVTETMSHNRSEVGRGSWWFGHHRFRDAPRRFGSCLVNRGHPYHDSSWVGAERAVWAERIAEAGQERPLCNRFSRIS